MSTSPLRNEPTYTLELRAADQRRRLHGSVSELRSKMKEKLDVKRNARHYLVPASAAGALLGVQADYSGQAREARAGLEGLFRTALAG